LRSKKHESRNSESYVARIDSEQVKGCERLLGCENDEVRFRWRDYAHGNKTKVMRILAEAFIRRFLRHVLPKGSQRGAQQAASLCLACPLAPAEPFRPPSLRGLLFLKVIGKAWDCSFGQPFMLYNDPDHPWERRGGAHVPGL
jgi:Putative transposase